MRNVCLPPPNSLSDVSRVRLAADWQLDLLFRDERTDC